MRERLLEGRYLGIASNVNKLSSYLKELRKSRGLTQIKIARRIHEHFPKRALKTIQTNDIIGYEHGLVPLDKALEKNPTQYRVFLLYVNTLQPTQEERDEILKLAKVYNPDFRFGRDATISKILASKPENPAQKLKHFF